MPSRIVINIPAAEQARLRKQLRGARWGGWLVLHILLLLAQQRSPTEIADWLLCSRSTVYAAAHAWQSGRHTLTITHIQGRYFHKVRTLRRAVASHAIQ